MESVERAAKAPQVTAVVDPYSVKALSPHGRIGFADVIYPFPKEDVEEPARRRWRRPPSRPCMPAWGSSSAGGIVTEERRAPRARR